MTLRTLDLARWRRAEAREMALRPPFRLNVHNRAKCDIARASGGAPPAILTGTARNAASLLPLSIYILYIHT